MKRRVRIEHKDGRSYQVTPADFRRKNVAPEGQPKATYEEMGFRIVRWADGEDYESPKKKDGGGEGEGE